MTFSSFKKSRGKKKLQHNIQTLLGKQMESYIIITKVALEVVMQFV